MRELLSRHTSVLFPLGVLLVAGLAGYLVASGGTSAAAVVFGGLAALVIVSATLMRPELAPLVLVVAAVYDKRIYFNYEQLQVTILVVMLVLATPAFAYSWVKCRDLPRYLTRGSLLISFGLVLAWIVAPNQASAAVGTIRWLLVINMILGTVALLRSRPKLGAKLAWLFVAGGAVASALAMAQRSGIYFLVGPPYAKGVYNSTFEYYSNFANFAAMASVVGAGLYLHIHRSGGKGRFPLAILTALCAYGALASLSRGASIAMGIGLAVIVLRQVTRPGRFLASLVGVAALAGLVWLLISEEFRQDLISRFLVAPRGDIVRRQMQQGGLEVLGESPLGIGFNNFKDFVSSGLVYGQQALSHTHNTYIQMGLDSGWLGLLGFLVVVVGASLTGVKAKDAAIRLGATAALIGCLGQITQDYFFFEPASMVLFATVLALAAGVDTRRAPDEQTDITPTVSQPQRHTPGGIYVR